MAFMFRLEQEDGAPAEPPTPRAARPDWRIGDSIYFGQKTLQVIALGDPDGDKAPILGCLGRG